MAIPSLRCAVVAHAPTLNAPQYLIRKQTTKRANRKSQKSTSLILLRNPETSSTFNQPDLVVAAFRYFESGIAPSTTDTAATLTPSVLPLRRDRAELTSEGSST